MVSLGIGLGAFAQGLGQGMQAAQQVKGVIDDKKIRKIQKDGAAEASAARERDLSAAIETTTNPDGSTAYAVGGKPQASLEDARKSAANQIGSVMDYYRTTTVPKLIQGYIDIGQPQQAERLQSYMDSQESQQVTKDWARATRLAMMGDRKNAMRRFGKLYERLEPGSKFVGSEDITEPVYETRTLPKTGEKIQVQTGTRPAGVRLKLRNPDGEDVSHDFSDDQDLWQTAMFTLSPDKFAERGLAEVDRAAASAAMAAKEGREFQRDVSMKKLDAVLMDQQNQRQFERGVLRDDRQFTQQTQRDATQQGYDLEKLMTAKQLEAAFAPAIEAAKVKGETPEAARKAITDIWKSMVTADIRGDFQKMPVEQQVKRASDVYTQQSRAAKGVTPGGPAATPQGVPKLW